MQLAVEHRVIIVSAYLGMRLCRRLMWMLPLVGRRALHAPVGRHLGHRHGITCLRLGHAT